VVTIVQSGDGSEIDHAPSVREAGLTG